MSRRRWFFVLIALSLAAPLWAQNEAEIYRAVSPSVVSIEVEISQFDTAGGAGFVIDEDGHILTNAHVVEGAVALTVLFHDGYESPAKLVGTDPNIDLAVIKVDIARRRLKPVIFGDSKALAVGEAVMAIGSPLGFEASLTSGVISGLNRELEFNDGAIMQGAIQTDAALEPGNSGGPLLNQAGEVIGVNSAGYRGTALGFAIPSNLARRVADRLILAAAASATREALNTTDARGTANAMIATANAMVAAADERAAAPASVMTATPTETQAAGEGTFSDPTKRGWRWSDGDGRWVGVGYYTLDIDEQCRRSNARCKDLAPGNQFIGVMVHAECEESRRTRCEFNVWDFEVAGKRGIPYSAEHKHYFDTLGEPLLPDALMPGSSFDGLVVFEVPRSDGDLRFGWTPSYGRSTLWFAMTEYEALLVTQAAERSATAIARAPARETRRAQMQPTWTARAANAQARQTHRSLTLTAGAPTRRIRQTATSQARTATVNALATERGAATRGARETEQFETASAQETKRFATGWARATQQFATLEANAAEAAGATPPPSATPMPDPNYYITADSAANLRAGPGINYVKVGVASPGDIFEVIGYQAGSSYNWLQLRYDGGIAWIAEALTRRRG